MLSKTHLSDEELLLMSRLGDQIALSTLLSRIFGMRNYSCRIASPEATAQLDDWEQNEAVHHAFYSAVDGYEFGDARFITYYHSILRNQLVHLAMKKAALAPHGTLSLEAPVTEEGTYVLQDLIPGGEEDDPAAFFRYAETLASLKRLPKNIEPLALDIVESLAQGHSIAEAARLFGLKPHRARYLVFKYRNWCLSTLARVYNLTEEETAEKEKLLNASLHIADVDKE